jgi:class 3 adenylate cyclase
MRDNWLVLFPLHFNRYGASRVNDTPLMPSDPAKPSGERRQVTVLFADMVGFTAISERLGEEGTYALIQPDL